MEILLLADTQEFHTALHYTLWRISITTHYPVGQRAMVHSYTYCSMMFLANPQKRYQSALYLFKLRLILLIGIFQMLECPCGIQLDAGSDADAFYDGSRNIGYRRIEVDISNQRCKQTFLT